MKKALVLASVITVILCVSENTLANLSGAGTELNPYLIQSRSDFDEFANPANAETYWASGVYTKLMCNLDLSDTIYNQAPEAWSMPLDTSRSNPRLNYSDKLKERK